MFRPILKRLFILIPVFAARLCFAARQDERGLELERLVITKQEQSLLNTYQVDPLESGFNFSDPAAALLLAPVDMQARSKEGIQADFSLRGSTFQQVLVLVNGHRVNDPQTAHHNSDLPFTRADLQTIAVVPGAASSLFGPDAIGGALNFILEPPGAKRAILELSAGNLRNGRSLFSLSDKFKNLGYRLSVEDEQSRGFRYDTEFKKFTSSLATRWELGSCSWENNFGYQEKSFGAYDFYTPGRDFASFEWTKTYLFSSDLSLNAPGFLAKPAFLWRRHLDKFALDRRQPVYNEHRTDMFTPGIYFQKETALLGKTGLGFEWGLERIVSTNLGDHERRHNSIYLDDSLSLADKWELGFSLRRDDFSDFGAEHAGSLSARYKFDPRNSLNFGVSRSLRLPSFTELYYSDSTTQGNLALKAESAWNYQAGYEFKGPGFGWGLAFFYRKENQMIDWVRRDPAQKWQARNFTRDQVFGAEGSARKKFSEILSADAGYAFTDKIIDGQGYLYKYGPNYARHLTWTTLNFQTPFGKQSLGFVYKQRPGRRGWLLVNAGLNYDINKHTRVFLNMENLLNVEYQDIPGIPQPGRSLQAGFHLEW